MAISPPPSGSTRESFIDPQALMSIRNLELRAKVVVEGFWTGIHRSPYHGFSVEFSEYRQYTAGDDPRYLDWRVFARSDRFFIKKFEEETNLRCHVLADSSRSMSFGSTGFLKADYAATLAATLARFLYLQGDAVGLLTFDEKIRDYLPARHRSGHLRHLMLALEKPSSGGATNLGQPLRRVVEIVRKRGLVMLISDFLAPLESFEPELVSLAACGHEVIVFQVLDPAEVTFEFRDPAMFEDVESGRALYVDPAQVRKDYLRKFRAHRAALETACRKLGLLFYPLVTNRPLELALFDVLRSRMEFRRKTNRVGRYGGARRVEKAGHVGTRAPALDGGGLEGKGASAAKVS